MYGNWGVNRFTLRSIKYLVDKQEMETLNCGPKLKKLREQYIICHQYILTLSILRLLNQFSKNIFPLFWIVNLAKLK